MKTFIPSLLMAAGVLLSGCASNPNGLVVDPVGPALSQPMTADATSGTLVVYSAYKRNADFNSRDSNRPEYSDYRILTADGHLLRRVRNNSGTIFQDAVTETLAPGKYNVSARANSYGYLTVPVVIEAQHSTILHLEGGSPWPDASVFNQTNAVQLPDGQIIGWKAAAN
jgi:hypothetical protein